MELFSIDSLDLFPSFAVLCLTVLLGWKDWLDHKKQIKHDDDLYRELTYYRGRVERLTLLTQPNHTEPAPEQSVDPTDATPPPVIEGLPEPTTGEEPIKLTHTYPLQKVRY